MEKIYDKFSQLPLEQLRWLMSYKKSLNIPPHSNKDDYSFIIELIERKAFYRGYVDLVIVLNTKGVDEFLINMIN